MKGKKNSELAAIQPTNSTFQCTFAAV